MSSHLKIIVHAQREFDIPTVIIPEMCELATRLGVQVMSDLNYVTVTCEPNDAPSAVVAQWKAVMAKPGIVKSASAKGHYASRCYSNERAERRRKEGGQPQ
jgi:hypothetical protein